MQCDIENQSISGVFGIDSLNQVTCYPIIQLLRERMAKGTITDNFSSVDKDSRNNIFGFLFTKCI